MGQEQNQQVIQVMGARHADLELFQQSLKVLLCGLLAMEADAVMQWDAALADLKRDQVVVFGLLYPLLR